MIRLDEWTINLGLVAHNDELFGQGLRANSSNVSGLELAPGNIYSMYEVDFGDTLSPRVGATWSYNGKDTVYANYAKYYPAANSLPRAASWARNLRRSIRAYFDAAGNYIGTDPVRSSSGKFFQPHMNLLLRFLEFRFLVFEVFLSIMRRLLAPLYSLLPIVESVEFPVYQRFPFTHPLL